jgi:hypothetical protein
LLYGKPVNPDGLFYLWKIHSVFKLGKVSN